MRRSEEQERIAHLHFIPPPPRYRAHFWLAGGLGSLTLIRTAGGVYDFRNFEEVYLCNGSSSDLQNSSIPGKTSREYILLNTLEQKMAFSAIYMPKRARNRTFFRRFFAVFRYFVRLWRYIWPLHHRPRAGHSPRQ
jgi:hypothetical protein